MSFTCPHIIHGWFTEARSWRGRDGIRILEFGMAVHTSRSDSDSESAGSAVLDGAGLPGDLSGVADTRFITTTGITPAATRFITGAVSTGEAYGVEFKLAATQ